MIDKNKNKKRQTIFIGVQLFATMIVHYIFIFLLFPNIENNYFLQWLYNVIWGALYAIPAINLIVNIFDSAALFNLFLITSFGMWIWGWVLLETNTNFKKEYFDVNALMYSNLGAWIIFFLEILNVKAKYEKKFDFSIDLFRKYRNKRVNIIVGPTQYNPSFLVYSDGNQTIYDEPAALAGAIYDNPITLNNVRSDEQYPALNNVGYDDISLEVDNEDKRSNHAYDNPEKYVDAMLFSYVGPSIMETFELKQTI